MAQELNSNLICSEAFLRSNNLRIRVPFRSIPICHNSLSFYYNKWRRRATTGSVDDFENRKRTSVLGAQGVILDKLSVFIFVWFSNNHTSLISSGTSANSIRITSSLSTPVTGAFSIEI